MNKATIDEILKLDRQLCFKLYKTSRNMTRAYQPLLDEFELTYPQYIVLLVLFEEHTISFNALSQKVDLRKPTLTPIVNRLVARGILTKSHDQSDKRTVILALTEQGYTLKSNIIKVPITLYKDMKIEMEHYTKLMKELDGLLELLE